MRAHSGHTMNVNPQSHFQTKRWELTLSDEIGTWRALRYRFGRKYIKAYHKHFPISAPSEDHDDRSALYAM